MFTTHFNFVMKTTQRSREFVYSCFVPSWRGLWRGMYIYMCSSRRSAVYNFVNCAMLDRVRTGHLLEQRYIVSCT